MKGHTNVSRKPPEENTRECCPLVELQAETLDLSLWGICFYFLLLFFVDRTRWRASASISSSFLSAGTPEEEAPSFFCCCLSIVIHAFSFDFEALCAWFQYHAFVDRHSISISIRFIRGPSFFPFSFFPVPTTPPHLHRDTTTYVSISGIVHRTYLLLPAFPNTPLHFQYSTALSERDHSVVSCFILPTAAVRVAARWSPAPSTSILILTPTPTHLLSIPAPAPVLPSQVRTPPPITSTVVREERTPDNQYQ